MKQTLSNLNPAFSWWYGLTDQKKMELEGYYFEGVINFQDHHIVEIFEREFPNPKTVSKGITPGKWEVKRKDANTLLVRGKTSTGETVCSITHPFGDSEAEANARLIAAAPKLVELLNRVQEMAVHKEGDLQGNKARTGIFKHIDQAPQLYTDIRNLLDKL